MVAAAAAGDALRRASRGEQLTRAPRPPEHRAAASEVAVGLAIFLSLYSTRETINLDEVDLLKH